MENTFGKHPFVKKSFTFKQKNHYVFKGNLSLLNTNQMKKFNKLKFLSVKYNQATNEYEKEIIYKNLTYNDKKIIIFDCVISYDLSKEGEMIHPFFNVYIPTVFIDYLKFCYKGSLLCDPENIKLDDLDKLKKEVYSIFASQNKFYTYDDYVAIKEKYDIHRESDFKKRIKALYDYTNEKTIIPGFYFYLAVMHSMIPLKYMGKCGVSPNDPDMPLIFFKEPEDNIPFPKKKEGFEQRNNFVK